MHYAYFSRASMFYDAELGFAELGDWDNFRIVLIWKFALLG